LSINPSNQTGKRKYYRSSLRDFKIRLPAVAWRKGNPTLKIAKRERRNF
jgi:hypothetical protein